MGIRRSLLQLGDHLNRLVEKRLWLQVIIAMFLGVGFGVLIGPTTGILSEETSEVIAGWVALPGRLFLTAIQFVIVPLIVASVIRGIAAGDETENLGKLGLYTMVFFAVSTVIAVIIGLGVATLIKPGTFIDSEVIRQVADVNHAVDVVGGSMPGLKELPETVLGLFPKDPLTTFVSGNMLQTVISAMIIALALVAMPIKERKPLLDLLASVQSVCMVIVGWVLRFVPIAVFGLLANISARVGVATLIATGIYVVTVLAGLLMLLLIYIAVIAIFAKYSPGQFLKNSREVLLLALSTSSSAAVMPLTLSTTENSFKVRSGISRFVIPLGTTVNMAGTALYQGVATLFLAQVFQVDIGLSGMIMIVVMATGASIGSPGTPGVGIVILATILESVGIPAAGIVLIMGVDRILDMCRTSVNVTGDMAAALTLNALIPEEKVVER
jgi:Na+/H+-dicarboxylate symporter